MARPKVQELPNFVGEGITAPKDKKLDALADQFVDLRDSKAEIAEQITQVEKNIIDRMVELKLEKYRYADREVTIKYGKAHVKTKEVKNEGSEAGSSED